MATIAASAARTATGVGTSVSLARAVTSAQFVLDVTAAGTLVGDTLDVFLQSSYDEGVTWDDYVHFTQVLGNGGAKKFIATWARDIAPTTALRTPQDGVLAAGVSQGPIGALIRPKWVIVDGGGTHSFTFAVLASWFRR